MIQEDATGPTRYAMEVAELKAQMESQAVSQNQQLAEIRELLSFKPNDDLPRKKQDMKTTPKKSGDKSSDLGQSEIVQA